MSRKVIAVMGASLVAAAGSGALVAVAVSSSAPAPQKVVTVNVGTGQTGPTGPQGPPGVVDCPTGFVPGEVVINHPGGHVTIYGCIQ